LLVVLAATVAWIATTREYQPPDAHESDTQPHPNETRSFAASEKASEEREPLADQILAASVREPASVITGTVRWPDGLPGEGAEVVLTALSGEASRRYSGWTLIRHIEADGMFRFDNLVEGGYAILARAIRREGTNPVVLFGWWLATTRFQVPRAEPMDLILRPMESIHGRASGLDGRNLEAFEIKAVPLFDGEEPGDGRTPYHWNFAPQDGSFEFVGMLPGTWEVSLTAQGYAVPCPRKIEVPYREPLDFELVRNVEVSGHVVDSTGENQRAVARAKWIEDGVSIAAGTASDGTWGDGLFRVRVPPTTVELQASWDGVDSQPITLDLSRGGTREGLTIVIPRKQ